MREVVSSQQQRLALPYVKIIVRDQRLILHWLPEPEDVVLVPVVGKFPVLLGGPGMSDAEAQLSRTIIMLN